MQFQRKCFCYGQHKSPFRSSMSQFKENKTQGKSLRMKRIENPMFVSHLRQNSSRMNTQIIERLHPTFSGNGYPIPKPETGVAKSREMATQEWLVPVSLPGLGITVRISTNFLRNFPRNLSL